MLRFIFSILVVILDQFFKRWIVLTLEVGQESPVIPGLLSLFHLRNNGAAFNFLADQRWLLAGIQLLAAFILIAILLRYTDGFWGTLGLAAVLGGTIGNLTDRVFLGYVVDMFRFDFVNFAIFNIADVFITLGFATFLVQFIITSFRSPAKAGIAAAGSADSPHIPVEYEDDIPETETDFPVSSEEIPSSYIPPEFDFTAFSDTADADTAYSEPSDTHEQYSFYQEPPQDADLLYDSGSFPEQDPYVSDSPETYFEPDSAYYTPEEPVPEPQAEAPAAADTASMLDVLTALESELVDSELLVDYDVDKLLSEYGFDSDGS